MNQYKGSDKPTASWKKKLKDKKFDLPALKGNETREEIIQKIITYLQERKSKKGAQE